MENIANRFWLYLLEKKQNIMTKEEIKNSYNSFQKLWGGKPEKFSWIFDTLRKSRLRYIFNKRWYVLSQEEFNNLKHNSFNEYEVILKFLENQNISFYIGLSSAKYFNQLTWQSMKVIYIINPEFKLKRKISNIEIRLIKFPKDLIINMSLIKPEGKYPYSDTEKTFLDEIYYNLHKKGKLQVMDYNFKELDIEKIKAYLTFYSKYPLVKKEVIKKLNKKQISLL